MKHNSSGKPKDRVRRSSNRRVTRVSDADVVAAICRTRGRNRRGQVGWDRLLWHAYSTDPKPGAGRDPPADP